VRSYSDAQSRNESAAKAASRSRLSAVERIETRREKLMVMEGVAPSLVKGELNADAARRQQLESQLAGIEEVPPLLHPEMAPHLPRESLRAGEALPSRTAGRRQRSARGIVDAIVLTPDQGRRSASDRIAREPGRHAGRDRTNEEVVRIRRPLLASLFGCGGGI